MKKIHQLLEQNSSGYAKWHQHPRHSFHHFMVFIFLACLTTVATLSSVHSLKLSYEENLPVINLAKASSQHNKNLKASLNVSTTKLLLAIKHYQNANGQEKQATLSNLHAVANERQQMMLKAAAQEPDAFLLSSLPKGLADKLPEEISTYIEKMVEVEGEITVNHIDFENPENNFFEYLVKNSTGKIYNTRFSGNQPDWLTGQKIKVKGVALDNELVVEAADGTGSVTTDVPYSAGPTGQQSLIAIPINFTDNSTNTPWSISQINATLFTNNNSVNNYYKQNTYQKTWFTGTTTPFVTVPYTNTGCDYYSWAYAAESAATQMGYNLANYNRKLFVIAGGKDCAWGGVSNVGGNPSRSWVKSPSPYYDNHELGHALGMRHSSSYSCGSEAISLPANCSQKEYGDIFDPMGTATQYHNNAAQKVRQTWLSGSNVQTVITNGTYEIFPLESVTSAVQTLKIYKPDTQENYYLEYRQPIGFDSTLPSGALTGAGIHVYLNTQTKLLDMTPGDGTFSNSYLTDGASFRDLINGITVTQLSHTPSSSLVQVTFTQASCYPSNPQISLNPSSQSGTAGQSLTYKATVLNKDSSACGSSTFSVNASNLPSGFTSSGGTTTLNPGASATINVYVSSSGTTADGSYLFNIKATDTNNASHTATAQANYIAFTDSSAPQVSITSPISGSSINSKGNRTTSVKASATDNNAVVKMEIYINNQLVATQTASPISYSWNTRNLSAGAHSITAKAFDAAGNVGSSTITVYK